MKIRPVEAELFHADRRTGMAMVIVAFRNSASAPKYFKMNCYGDFENYSNEQIETIITRASQRSNLSAPPLRVKE